MKTHIFKFAVITLMFGSPCFKIRAMDAGERVLIRTLSIMPFGNPFWNAVEHNDLQLTAELIPLYFPIALDCQYAVYKAANSNAMRRLILKTIEEYWFSKIETHPLSALTSFFHSYKQLISKNSFPQGVIERPFMQMFSRLKERAMTSKAIVLEKKVVRLIQRMPHESDPETLREISGRSIARTIYEQRKNLSDELENVPLDIREIVALYYKELQDEQTMTFKSLI